MDVRDCIKGITNRFIEVGKPSQDGYVESSNSKIPDECLNRAPFSESQRREENH